MSKWRRSQFGNTDPRIEIIRWGLIVFAAVIAFRLAYLQILQHGFYSALASDQRELFEELVPKRGDILIHDYKDETVLPIATNQQLAFVYADPRKIEGVVETARTLGEILDYKIGRASCRERV